MILLDLPHNTPYHILHKRGWCIMRKEFNISGLETWESPTIKPGQKYGKLTILSTHCKSGTYKYYAICDCDCGTKNYVSRIDHLRTRKNIGCGCAQKEAVTTHGRWNHPLFSVWTGIMSRCYNINDKRYNCYGQRGIAVCDKWKDVNQFILDMEPTYKPGLQIDRIDNNNGYFPENCRWATRTEQARNKSSNVKIYHNGKNLCLAEWSEITGINNGTLRDRILTLKWSAEKALTTPALSAKERCLIARNIRDKPVTSC